jgi:hypothetical protein
MSREAACPSVVSHREVSEAGHQHVHKSVAFREGESMNEGEVFRDRQSD